MTPPAIVLLHPAGGGAHSYDAVLPLLGNRRVIVPALPGRPGSPGPHPGTAEQAAAWIRAQLAGLGIARAIVGGHSVGGAVAIELALAPGDLVIECLVLIATGARLRVRPEILAAQKDPASLADWKMADAFDRMKEIASIRVPTIVLSGTEDPFTPPKYAAFLRDAIPGATLVTLEGAGHFLPDERPQAVADALL